MNGHGMTCHAGVAQATTELMLRGNTVMDLQPILGRREQLNFGVLDADRFEQGALLDFTLQDTPPRAARIT
jgi:sarcosine oxidase subunit beta